MPYGAYVRDISNAYDTRNVIINTVWEDDYIVQVSYSLGSYIRFQRDLYVESAISIGYDPPAENRTARLGPGQEKNFDNRPLSQRSPSYQRLAVNWFATTLLSRYLRKRKFLLDPTEAVTKVAFAMFVNRYPETEAEFAQLVCQFPEALQRVQVSDAGFSADRLSDGARAAILALLEDQDRLAQYLREPRSFLESYAQGAQPEEIAALTALSEEQPALVENAFDQVELGGSAGDGNTYILLGMQGDQPSVDNLEWLKSGIGQFVEKNGFAPSVGWYLTAAQACHRVILGPGVSDRDRRFLEFMGHEIIDRRDGAPLADLTLERAPAPGENQTRRQQGAP